MLSSFDWLRRSRTGAELIVTLKYLEERPDLFSGEEEIGPPHSALNGPCRRCWLYSRQPEQPYCPACQLILDNVGRFAPVSRHAILIWGYVNQLPKQLHPGRGFQEHRILYTYIHDDHRFLLAMYRRGLKPWLQELALYHGDTLKGMLQIFPTMGAGEQTGMSDILCRAIHREADFSRDRLRVKFFADAYEVLRTQDREREGILIFEIADFLSVLEMAAIFRTVLRPEEQKIIYELLRMEDVEEEKFYWGRLLGQLNQEAKDMLNAWKIRSWPPGRVKLLYELIDYVVFYRTD
ncbi:MAG: hypothetical protein JW953_22530 [Anaerolineae bacterium]|nr:hypothetical protein [Anaerolineae bacterium]